MPDTIRQHLLDRHLDMKLHRVWIDEEERVAVFPLYNLSGVMVGYQMYRPDADKGRKNHPKEGRYYTFFGEGSRGVWGLESFYLSDTLFITEGLFDAARLTGRGFSAIAVLSNDPKHISSWLGLLRAQRKVVAVCDSGSGGKKLAKYGSYSVITPEGKDLGDVEDYYVDEILEVYNEMAR